MIKKLKQEFNACHYHLNECKYLAEFSARQTVAMAGMALEERYTVSDLQPGTKCSINVSTMHYGVHKRHGSICGSELTSYFQVNFHFSVELNYYLVFKIQFCHRNCVPRTEV